MSYITSAELTTLVPEQVMYELSNDTPGYAVSEIDFDKVNAIVAEACETVDGYLRGRYRLPFASTPTLVSGIAKQIARYKLYERRPEGFDLPDTVRNGYTDALKDLVKIQNGVITLGVPEGELLAGQQIADDGEFHVHVRPSRNRQSTFSKDLLDQY